MIKFIVVLILLTVAVSFIFWRGDDQGEADIPYSTQLTATKDKEPISEPSSVKPKLFLNDDDRLFVCRAAIAEMMGRDISMIEARMVTSGEVETSYSRPSDKSVWKNRCIPADGVVRWASIDGEKVGRWRDSAQDEMITFELSENEVMIRQTFSGGGGSLTGRFERE